MNENNQLRAFLAFLFLLIVLTASHTATAAINAVPSVSGYTAGFYSSAAGTFSTAANAASYGASGVVSVGGKSITVPATLRMAANAGQYAKNAMRLNPYMIAGTLAAGWLLDQMLQWDESSQSWVSLPSVYPGGTVSQSNACDLMGPGQYARDSGLNRIVYMPHPPLPVTSPCPSSYSPYASCSSAVEPYYQPGNLPYTVCINPTSANQPFPLESFPPEAWDSLPDPLPSIAPELPYAPFMPEGVPVDAPEYDFVPFQVPVGEPYTRPDSSTVQPMATVSPNGDSVTIDTYDLPLTDSNGDPVAAPAPVDTAEPVPTQTQCDKYPATLGCASLDVPETENLSTETRDVSLITPVSVGGAGVCPAPLVASFLGQQVEMSFEPLCQFANSLRPLVLVLAWLSAGVIFIGGVRNG